MSLNNHTSILILRKNWTVPSRIPKFSFPTAVFRYQGIYSPDSHHDYNSAVMLHWQRTRDCIPINCRQMCQKSKSATGVNWRGNWSIFSHQEVTNISSLDDQSFSFLITVLSNPTSMLLHSWLLFSVELESTFVIDRLLNKPITHHYKVITTLVIKPLDDPTWCAQSVVAVWDTLESGMCSFDNPPIISSY